MNEVTCPVCKGAGNGDPNTMVDQFLCAGRCGGTGKVPRFQAGDIVTRTSVGTGFMRVLSWNADGKLIVEAACPTDSPKSTWLEDPAELRNVTNGDPL